MPQLKWQLELQGRPIKGGKVIAIMARRQTDRGVELDLQDVESLATASFLVRNNVNIGGKDYLLIHADTESADELTAIRMLNKSQLSAMDPDRFSSLVNAIYRYLEETPPTSTEELARVLGDLPRDPGFSP
jgi:hypothetical protein